jgi:hypothetical protein
MEVWRRSNMEWRSGGTLGVATWRSAGQEAHCRPGDVKVLTEIGRDGEREIWRDGKMERERRTRAIRI